MVLDARSIDVSSRQSARGLAMMALQIMERQVERLETDPEMEAALRRHIQEPHRQRERLEDALDTFGSKPSTGKGRALGVVGNAMTLGHTPAQDESLRKHFADQAFQKVEIAAYPSLLTVGDAAGQTADR